MRLGQCRKWFIVIVLLGVLLPHAKIQSAKSSEPVYIRSDGRVIPITAPISTVDNITYTFAGNVYDEIVVQRGNIIVDGNGFTVQGSGGGYGLSLNSINGVTIENTNIRGFIEGIWIYGCSGINIIENNITGNTHDGIALYSSSQNSITNNSVKNSDYGIYLLSSSENTIRENSISETNSSGVWLDSSSNHNILDGNEFLDSGLFVSFSYGNIAEKNTVNGKPLVLLEGVTGSTVNYAGQVVLIACTNMRVENLDLSATAVGLELWQSNNSRIVGNKIAGNHFGILLYGSSNNDVLANTISNNGNGIQLWSSSNNRFWHNNLVDNKNHVHDLAWDDQEMVSSTSIWDMGYPSGGNYWNDYAGTDLSGGPFLNEAGSDGIGDSPRIIRGKELDNYPLMGTFSDFNASSEHHVQTICNSSISNFQYNGSAVYFDVKGIDGTIGFCRIGIPTALVNKPYKVFVNGTDVLYHELSCSNGTYSCLYFTYNHSTENVVIIPEFNLLMMIALSTIAALQMAMLNKKKSERHHVPA